MKKILFAVFALSMLAACSNEKKNDDKTGDEKKKSDNITLPYKAEYTDFKMGDPNHTKLVLDFIKTFEENRLKDGKQMLNDSVMVDFADGNKFKGPADSLISMGMQERASYKAFKFTLDACISVHSNDKNEDWVMIWNKEYTTDQNNKADSMGGHSYWQIKNGKIAYWGEQQAKLAPTAAMK